MMIVKLSAIAMVAGLIAQTTKKASLPILVGVVLLSELLGGIGEFVITGGIASTIADFTIGWPGLLLQVIGTYLILKI